MVCLWKENLLRLHLLFLLLLNVLMHTRMDLRIIEFEVLTAVTMKSAIFWDIMPRNLVEIHGLFGGTC
jgi:hypothetical protein